MSLSCVSNSSHFDTLSSLTILINPKVVVSPSVGRNGAAHSASLRDRAYFPHAELSPQSSSRRNVFLHGEPARPPLRSLGDRGRPAARRGSPGALARSFSYRCLGGPSRPHALPVDAAPRRRRLSRSLARDQARFCKILAHCGTALRSDDPSRRPPPLPPPQTGEGRVGAAIGSIRSGMITTSPCISTIFTSIRSNPVWSVTRQIGRIRRFAAA